MTGARPAAVAGNDRRPAFIRAAHYFADGWPLDSLLVMRRPMLRRELRSLRQAGFNTVILVVPWQGFQTAQDPPAYDSFYLAQLRLVIEEASRQTLSVLLRVSYVHQVMPQPTVGGIQLVQGLLTDEVVLRAWLDYQRTLYTHAAGFANCIGMFVAWEEFWHTFAHWRKLPAEKRRELARTSGFLDWAVGQGADEADAVEIPAPDAPGYRLYHGFFNVRFRSLVEAARNVNPLLGVEYRVDRDPLREGDELHWLENDLFFDLEPRRYSYWAPFWGSVNEGESLSCDEALTSLRTMLERTSDGGRLRGQVLEQFNFVDDTLQYAGTHAAIADRAVPLFLEAAAPLLEDYCGGYGLWAVRDYRCNILYNAAFLDGARGWHLERAVSLERGVVLRRAAVLSQHTKPGIPWVPRMHPFDEIELEIRCGFAARVLKPYLRAQLNGGGWVRLEHAGGNLWRAKLPVDFDSFRVRGIHFRIENHGVRVRLLRVHLYHLVYRGGVRDVDGEPGPYASAIASFNTRLGA